MIMGTSRLVWFRFFAFEILVWSNTSLKYKDLLKLVSVDCPQPFWSLWSSNIPESKNRLRLWLDSTWTEESELWYLFMEKYCKHSWGLQQEMDNIFYLHWHGGLKFEQVCHDPWCKSTINQSEIRKYWSLSTSIWVSSVTLYSSPDSWYFSVWK